MSKFVILLVVASLVACISADDDNNFDDFDPFGLGNIKSDFPKPANFIDGIKNLKVPQNGHAFGHAETHSHETKTVNGRPVLDTSSSDEVVNDDGDVTEQKADN